MTRRHASFLVTFIIAVIVALFLNAALSAASAQVALCGLRPDMLRGLSGTYSEEPSAMGLATNGGVVEVLTSPEGDTWTIIITSPNGMSCLIAAGENWEDVRPDREGSL